MMNSFKSKRSDFNNHESEEYDEIDKYLDGQLPEQEMEDFERRCFTDDALLLEVQERQKFRKQVAQVIKENASEIFSEDLYQDIANIIIKKSTAEFTKEIITDIAPHDLPLLDHFTQRYFEEDPEERSTLVLETGYRSAADDAAPVVNLTIFVLLVVESMMQSLREKSPEILRTITQETMREFLQQHARELLEQYREITKPYSAEIMQQVEKFGNYLKQLLKS